MSDCNIHKIMHLLCLRKGKEVILDDDEHWLGTKEEPWANICCFCGEYYAIGSTSNREDIELRDKHAIKHIKDHNLLPFI